MTNKILGLVFLLAIAGTACKKEKETDLQPDANSVTQSEDNNDLKAEGDQANSDVTDALENYGTINGRIAATQAKKVICGCSIDSVGLKTIRLSYDGVTPCGNPSRTRSGKITFTLVNGNRWSQQGAVLNITLDNYKVTRLRDSKSWNFNGTKTMTNVRGTNWVGFLARTDSLLYRERAKNMVVTINNNATVTYNIARTTTWKFVKEANREFIQFAAMGDTLLDGMSNVDTWGTSRFQNTFTNQYLSRLISDTYCLLWRPRAGEIQHKSNGNTLTLKFGVNESGQPDTRDCAYGWKINWTGANGGQGEKIFSY
jgi:hypothetical protein